MRKRIRFKSLLLDFFVVLLCLSVAVFFAWLFWQDLNTFTVRSDKDEIGTISFKQNVAQRKFDDRVVWERISTGTKLYYGDTIRTADLAQAVLTLKDGTVIDLGENTMIVVGSNASGGLQISIDGGEIQIDSAAASSALEVKLDDGSVVNVEAGSSLAATSDIENGVSNVEVKSGSAQITTNKGQTASLGYGESVNVEKGSELKINPLSVLYPPQELKLLNIREGALPLRFEWKTNTSEDLTIQFSSSKDFSTLLSSKSYSGQSAELNVQPGLSYWRAFTQSSKDKTVSGKISVHNIAPIEGISPAAETSFQYRAKDPQIFFRWTGSEYASRYRLLISSTPDMRSLIIDSEFTETFASINLGAGNYWWQVMPYYSLGKLGYAGESNVYSFKITKNQEFRRPELSAPADKAQIVYKDNILSSFIWKSEVKDASYELKIARDYDFNNVVFTAETDELRFSREFTPAELKEGNYYWKILRKSSDSDDLSPESEIRSFSVTHYLPQDNKLLYPPENFNIEAKNVNGLAFMWKLSDEYEKTSPISVLQISTRPDFTDIQLEKTSATSVLDSLNLPSGNYWWRVGVRDDKGFLTGITPSRSFTVLSELLPPLITTPNQQEEITVYNYAPVTISWQPLKDVKSYTLKIYNSKDDIVKVIGDIKENSVQVVLEEGKYRCTLQALASDTRISVPAERVFSVRYPSKILAQSPGMGVSIQGLTALRNPTVFAWLPGKDRPSSYKFVLSKLQKDGSTKIVNTVITTKTTFSIKRLTAGTYSWKVSASTAKGMPLDSNVQSFVIERVPDLSMAILDSPARNFVMDGDYLKKHRSIEFSWKEVAGATSYSFSLYKKEANGTRKLIYSEKNTKSTLIRIKDLSILDVGNFEWTVKAYSYAKDGYLEQSGPLAASAFKIDFASPTKVEAVKPGKMYGN